MVNKDECIIKVVNNTVHGQSGDGSTLTSLQLSKIRDARPTDDDSRPSRRSSRRSRPAERATDAATDCDDVQLTEHDDAAQIVDADRAHQVCIWAHSMGP